LMNNSGSLVDTLTTDAWGNVTSESSPATGDRFKFGGGQWDATIGLEHFGERWYDPTVARWVSQAPLGLSPDSNPYRYVQNGPNLATDPSGLAPSGPAAQDPNQGAQPTAADAMFLQSMVLAANNGDLPGEASGWASDYVSWRNRHPGATHADAIKA